MGICTIKKVYSITSSTQLIDPLLSLRIKLIDCAKSLHQFNVKCIQAVETCILNDQKQKAIIIKAKQIQVKKVAFTIQECIKNIDQAIEANKPNDFKNKLFEDVNNLLLGEARDVLIDDINEILEMDLSDQRIAEIEKALEINNQEKKEIILTELIAQRTRILRLNEASPNQRRTYVRTIN